MIPYSSVVFAWEGSRVGRAYISMYQFSLYFYYNEIQVFAQCFFLLLLLLSYCCFYLIFLFLLHFITYKTQLKSKHKIKVEMTFKLNDVVCNAIFRVVVLALFLIKFNTFFCQIMSMFTDNTENLPLPSLLSFFRCFFFVLFLLKLKYIFKE